MADIRGDNHSCSSLEEVWLDDRLPEQSLIKIPLWIRSKRELPTSSNYRTANAKTPDFSTKSEHQDPNSPTELGGPDSKTEEEPGRFLWIHII